MDKRRSALILNAFILALIIGLVLFFSWKYLPQLMHLIKNPSRFKHYIESFGAVGVLVYIAFQVLQVVVAAIPGEFIQIAGGYIYGTFLGTVYSILGIVLGSTIAFFIARGLGFRLLKNFISEEGLHKFTALLNNPRAEIVMFLLFLIPGVPKDFLVYAAGLTPIKPLHFLSICMLARFPAILASSFVGSNIHQKDYSEVIIVSSIACLFFVVGVLYREQITRWVVHGPLEKILHKKKAD